MRLLLRNGWAISIASREDLAKLVPPGHGRVLSYGQGEGQFEVFGATWAYYCAPAPTLVLEEGLIPFEEAMRIGQAILRQVNVHWGPNVTADVMGALDDPTLASRVYPSYDAVREVLTRLGIEPSERMGEMDQDAEYTAACAEEVTEYAALYRDSASNAEHRAVLCCFLLESLNELIQSETPHQAQDEVFEMLLASGEHAPEIAYWTNTSDPDPENWWPITTPLLDFRRSRSG